MSRGIIVAAIAAAAAIGGGPALAGDRSPAIVIPGRPGVPIIIDGRDVTGAVIEGDWGLDAPGLVYPTVIYYAPPGFLGPRSSGYFPATGRPPAYGRREITPSANRPLPPPAESFYRSWGAESDPVPASPPSAAQPVIVAPDINDGRRRRKR